MPKLDKKIYITENKIKYIRNSLNLNEDVSIDDIPMYIKNLTKKIPAENYDLPGTKMINTSEIQLETPRIYTRLGDIINDPYDKDNFYKINNYKTQDGLYIITMKELMEMSNKSSSAEEFKIKICKKINKLLFNKNDTKNFIYDENNKIKYLLLPNYDGNFHFINDYGIGLDINRNFSLTYINKKNNTKYNLDLRDYMSYKDIPCSLKYTSPAKDYISFDWYESSYESVLLNYPYENHNNYPHDIVIFYKKLDDFLGYGYNFSIFTNAYGGAANDYCFEEQKTFYFLYIPPSGVTITKMKNIYTNEEKPCILWARAYSSNQGLYIINENGQRNFTSPSIVHSSPGYDWGKFEKEFLYYNKNWFTKTPEEAINFLKNLNTDYPFAVCLYPIFNKDWFIPDAYMMGNTQWTLCTPLINWYSTTVYANNNDSSLLDFNLTPQRIFDKIFIDEEEYFTFNNNILTTSSPYDFEQIIFKKNNE